MNMTGPCSNIISLARVNKIMMTYGDSTETDLLETIEKHTPHPVIQVVKLLQGNQLSRKVTTPTAVVHADPL